MGRWCVWGIGPKSGSLVYGLIPFDYELFILSSKLQALIQLRAITSTRTAMTEHSTYSFNFRFVKSVRR